MLKIWDAANFRRTLTAICLIGAPLFFAAAELLSPPGTDSMDPAAILAQISQYHDQEMLTIILSSIAAILFIPLAVGLIHTFSERGVVLGHLGGGMIVLSSVLIIGLNGVNFVLWGMAAPGMNQAAMVPAMAAMMNNPILGVLFLGHWLFTFGILFLGIALWRSGAVPRWAGITLVLTVILEVGGGTLLGETPIFSALVDAMLVAGFGGVAWQLLTTSDAYWARMTMQTETGV